MMGTSILSIPWGIKQVNYEKYMHMKMLVATWFTFFFGSILINKIFLPLNRQASLLELFSSYSWAF